MNTYKLDFATNTLTITKAFAEAAADPSRGFNILGLLQSLFKRKKESKKERFRRMLKEY